ELHTPTPQQVRGLIQLGLGGSSGITSSAADASHGLAYRMVDPATNWVLVQLARYGDTNQDGTVDFTDLLALAQNYGRTNATWSQGDMNYDGKVDFADLLKLGQNFGKSLAAATPAVAAAALPDDGQVVLNRTSKTPVSRSIKVVASARTPSF